LAKGLLKMIQEFDNDVDKVVSIAIILKKKLIPYMQVPAGGQYVTDKRYKVLVNNLRPQLKLLSAIQNSIVKMYIFKPK